MSRLAVHVLLFALVAFAIVLMSALYSEPDDAKALRSLPRRYAVFMASCAAIVVVMLVVERVFLSL